MTYHFRAYFGLVMMCLLSACASRPNTSALSVIVEDYIQVYGERTDFVRFIDFYATDAIFEDMVYGHTASNRKAIANFFDWTANKVAVLDNKAVLVVTDKLIDVHSKHVILSGYFNRFRYQGNELGPWRFLIKLQFGSDGKILYQQDWINYTPKSQFMTGVNLNHPQ
ncbi:nuclear transport factor 2 family protein [Pseudoalteromonas sp. MMG013]|uniref:nuclear transport factor 2 family protein n=1 Tax=Pseudoalteromonas sp. MMG013 TaxID=2822687 RepID=UPI001B38B214|nr:nuclear transport factor 2 family protein [Pseudoalteromonas sp. MMG013]MBQ4861227.1 nuclear transport factor 2 family protein [Pseudoalteromonas sp. MMG013]